MVLSFSKKASLSLVITSTLTSALVVPRGAHHVVPAIDAVGDGSGQHYQPSGYQATGYPLSTTLASSNSIFSETSSISTSCTTSSTATVTLSGSSIASLASQTGYYQVSKSSTAYGPAPSVDVSSSTMGYSARPSMPLAENSATLGYPASLPTSMVIGPTGIGQSLAISSSFNPPMPYYSSFATVSVAPYPTTIPDLQGARVSYNTNPTGAASTPYIISTGYITPPAYGTGYSSLSSAAPYPTESGIYMSNILDSSVYSAPPLLASASPTPIASSITSVYVPTSPPPAVSGNMTTQYSPSQPVASAYSQQPAVPVSGSTSSTLPALDTTTGGLAYPTSSFMPLPASTSAAMSNVYAFVRKRSHADFKSGSSVAPSTLVTSAVPPFAASEVYDTPPAE